MKTPMSLEIISNWSLEQPPEHSLTIPELLSSQVVSGRCIGMIIDLANHECLYAEDLPESLEYTHIQLVAKVLPPFEAINAVAAAAAEFWARRPNDYIAIHCAYGFNRTGFVVCSYLCQVCGMTVPEALESFAQARPPGVKHGKFVDELYARYGTSTTDNKNIDGGGMEQLERLQEHEREEASQNTTTTTVVETAVARIDGEGDCDLRPPATFAASFAGGGSGAPPSDMISTQARKGSITNSNNSISSTPGGGGSSRSLDGGSDGSGGGSGAWKKERANSVIGASDEEYAFSMASLSLSTGASMGSPSNSLPILSSSARGFLMPSDGSRRSSSRSFLAVAEIREGNDKDRIIDSGVEEDPAATAATDDKKSAPDVDDYSEPPRTSGQWSEMAQQVDGKSLMRRETSLGLAKALHEDFGVHDSTPSGLTPSPLMKKLGAEEEAQARGEEDAGEAGTATLMVEDQVRQLNLETSEENIQDGVGVDVGSGREVPQFVCASVQQEGRELTPHSSTQRDNQHKVDIEIPSSTPPSATSLQESQNVWSAVPLDTKFAAAGTRESSAVVPPGSHTGDSFMSRNMSFESDCHSLGFNAREATTQLRLHQVGDSPGVIASFNRQPSIASDLDTTLWETSEDEGGEEGAAGKPKVGSRRQLPQEQRRDCTVM